MQIYLNNNHFFPLGTIQMRALNSEGLCPIMFESFVIEMEYGMTRVYFSYLIIFE